MGPDQLDQRRREFEETALVHMDRIYNTALRLTRNKTEAEDLFQETETLWSHFNAEAIHGPLQGTKLKPYPAIHTTWGQWKRLYPDSQVLSKRSSFGRTEGQYDVYEGYNADPDSLGIFGTRNPDSTLPGKEYVFGLTLQEGRIRISATTSRF